MDAYVNRVSKWDALQPHRSTEDVPGTDDGGRCHPLQLKRLFALHLDACVPGYNCHFVLTICSCRCIA